MQDPTPTQAKALQTQAAKAWRCLPEDIKIGNVAITPNPNGTGMLVGQALCARTDLFLGLVTDDSRDWSKTEPLREFLDALQASGAIQA